MGTDDAIVRISWVCGFHGANMVKTILKLGATMPELKFVDDQIGNPTFADDAARAIVDIATRGLGGIWHVTNQGVVSWYEFAREVLLAAGMDAQKVKPISTRDLQPPRPAQRPANSVLHDGKLEQAGIAVLQDFREPLARLVRRLLAETGEYGYYMDYLTLIAELEPVAAKLLERHMGVAKEWFPHEMVPYSRGRDFDPNHQWVPEDADFGDAGSDIDEAVRGALYLNLLTEDNLPYYFRDIDRLFGSDTAFGEWARNWTAEEGRHSIVMRDYFTVTRAVDPVQLERARMIQVRSGQVPAPHDAFEALSYVSMQELATRISHRNTGKYMTDPIGTDIMSRVGNDENLHYLFYRDLTAAALELDPSSTVLGIERAVTTFAMPGLGIPDFDRISKAVAKVGIYDLLIHHDQILEPCIRRHWKLEEVTGLSDDAERARENIFKQMARTQKVGKRLAGDRVDA